MEDGDSDLRRNLEDNDSDLRRDLEAGMDKMEASSSAVNLKIWMVMRMLRVILEITMTPQ